MSSRYMGKAHYSDNSQVPTSKLKGVIFCTIKGAGQLSTMRFDLRDTILTPFSQHAHRVSFS